MIKQQRNATGTQYTQNSLTYKHFTITSVFTECHFSVCIITLFNRRSNKNQEKTANKDIAQPEQIQHLVEIKRYR